MTSPKEKDIEIEEEIEENFSIEENISFGDNSDLSLGDPIPLDLNLKKRNLFELDTELGEPSKSQFLIDDELLSGENLAHHFQLPLPTEDDSLDAALNDINPIEENQHVAGITSDIQKSREVSPDDVILINDHKVSINSLKFQQEISQEGSTTHDISDIKDDTTVNSIQNASSRRELMKKSKSLDVTKLHPNVTDRNFRSFDFNVIDSHNETTQNADELSSLDPNININDESAINKILEDTQEPRTSTPNENIEKNKGTLLNVISELDQRTSTPNPTSLDHFSDGDDILNLKEKINSAAKELNEIIKEEDEVEEKIENSPTKLMEKIEFSKEMLDDISEESERALSSFEVSFENKKIQVVTEADSETIEGENLPSEKKDDEIESVIENENNLQSFFNNNSREYPIDIPQLGTGLGQTSDFDSVISLNMFQMMENKVRELQDIIAGKDVCLAALNMQIEAFSRRESLKESRDSLKEMPSSGRASSSLATSSTEYRTIQDDYVNKLFDYQGELTERENLIEQLTESLQQSMLMREQLQTQGEKLTTEVIQLRKQLGETLEIIKKPHWMRDQECGQRISEISIDLVSETDEESADKNYALKYDNKSNRNSTERQLDELFDQQLFPSFSKEIEQFITYLSNDELHMFNKVQKKFDDFLGQELKDVKSKYDEELKSNTTSLKMELEERETEVDRLKELVTNMKCGSTEIIELRTELEAKHSQEMEDLRTYFERKCADLEKQYSEEVFSQQSRRHSHDSGSDISDQENLPIEEIGSPIKKTKEDIYLSPTHRKITPTTIGTVIRKKITPLKGGPSGDGIDEPEMNLTIDELKIFYQDKINELTINHEASVKKIHLRLRQFETRNADDEFVPENLVKTGDETTTTTNNNYEQHEFNTIIAEYERRLQEQVALARQDVLNELDIQIQALLSETSVEDSHWPPELILLREKFTAKSQLEIAQIQIKHEEEMARVKSDYEKQLSRKLKRNTTFDSTRDLDEILIERDNLRELSNTLRWLLCELAKYCTICEDDLNNTFIEELQKHGVINHNLEVQSNHSDDNVDLNISGISNKSQQRRTRFTPDVSGILSIIEEPSLIEYISHNKNPLEFRLNLEDCLERLKNEAMYILKLSENINKKTLNGDKKMSDKDDSCEEEDGLKKSFIQKREKFSRAKSLNDSTNLNIDNNKSVCEEKITSKSLPLFSTNLLKENLNDENESADDDVGFSDMNSELNIRLHELKNRLVKSEDEKKSLELELAEVLSKHDSLASELHATKEQLETLEGQKEIFMEGFGANLVSPRHQASLKRTTNLIDLQERAKNILNTSHNQTAGDNTTTLMQLVEDFCREGDRFMEEGKKDKDDLQAQIQLSNTTTVGHSSLCCDKIDAADKQLKGTRHFLEEQAAEREQERDDFTKEIERLKLQLKEREKEKHSYDRVSKEVEVMENQIKDMSALVTDYEEKKQKYESDLKASIDKIFVLREIISELESQVETKNVNENILQEKINELESFLNSQNKSNETLQNEVESLKFEVDGRGYSEKIAHLEEQLKKSMNSAEQSLALEQITGQLREIEMTLEKKTKTLESLHSAICSISCSSPSEDVSVEKGGHQEPIQISANDSPHGPPSLPVDEVQRIMEKLIKHTRAEEAALKRIKDLEMQVGGVRESYTELQRERDILQEKLSEQLNRISSLQSRLDEQRNRAEELHRQGTSDLNIRVHDLKTELSNLKETLSSRDKQIATLKEHLEQSKKLIDSQEAEIAMVGQTEQSDRYELQLKVKNEENQRLKEKIKNEMINKLALPDLMETMLADKNEEIDHFKEQLQLKEKELKIYLDLNLDERQLRELQKTAKEIADGKLSARTLSDIVSISSEYDEPDMIRKYVDPHEIEGGITFNMGGGGGGLMTSQQLDSGRIIKTNETFTRSTNEMTIFGLPQTSVLSGIAASGFFQDLSVYPKTGSSLTPEILPRKINFSFGDSQNSGSRKDKEIVGAFIEEIFDEKELSDIPEEDVDKLKDEVERLRGKLKNLPKLESEVESLKLSLETVTNEKNLSIEELKNEVKTKIDVMSNLQVELAAKERLYDELIVDKKELESEIDHFKTEMERLESELKRNENEIKNHLKKISELENILSSETNKTDMVCQIASLSKLINEKDDMLMKLEKDIVDYVTSERLNIDRIKGLEVKIADLEMAEVRDQLSGREQNVKETDLVETLRMEVKRLTDNLTETRRELSEKMIEYEKCKLDLEQIFLPERVDIESVAELRERLTDEITKNKLLSQEIEQLRHDLERNDNSGSLKPYSLDEIAEQVEKELNYSAQLDSSILKAIESDDLASEDENLEKKNVEELLRQTGSINDDFRDLKINLEMEVRKRQDLSTHNNEILQQLEMLKQKFETERLNCTRLQTLLDSEKKNSCSIQQQDATIIEAMRIRLEAAIDNESDLQKQLDDERSRSERLTTQMSVIQRSTQSNSLPHLKSASDSPKKSPKNGDSLDHLMRLESELKFMTSQNERERERVTDLQRVLERERHRFDKEVTDRIDFGERMKEEIERVLKEKDSIQRDLEHANERLELSSREIESLEIRIQEMASSDGKFEVTQGRSRQEISNNVSEIRQLREKLYEVEKERDHLNETIYLLRGDIERGAQREAKLAEALAREASGEGPVPQMFLQKLKETNDLLTENAKENRQMADTLQFLTEERRTLQNRCAELESGMGVVSSRDDLEERANHLFGRYLKTESFRKALVHQKRYLLIVLSTYQENEAKALAMMNGGDRQKRRKRKTFRSIVFLVIAVHRMKFIVRRWQTGKRVGGKAIFSSQMPRRSASATTNNWARSESYLAGHPNSPPCRDRPYHHKSSSHSIPIVSNLRSLQSPALISEHHKSSGSTRRLE